MRVTGTELDGVKLIVPEAFTDHRGAYVELYDTDKYRAACAGITFVQDDISVSKQHVLRGVHGDFVTTKLVSVLHGEGYALLADNRRDSPTFHRWQAFTLTGGNRWQLLIPPGIGNSVLALSDIVYWYKQDTHFVAGRQFTLRWDDPEWGFAWPIADPILSARDQRGAYVGQS
ncbi:MAG TPA: dTDP-4-dehydrorhamnose 3,5-epimerase family protein [Planctomycetota bacterium]|nr:dTDP-4-dehydrorhamnose 3,5-epimerase family protein [Planctomycetota bacterium]